MGGNQTQGDQQSRRKFKIFAPVTIKMIEDCVPGPNDVCEIDGENINEVSILGRVTLMEKENMRHLIGLEDSTGHTMVTFYQKGDHNVP